MDRPRPALPVLLFFISVLQVTDQQVVPLLLPVFEHEIWPGRTASLLIVTYALGAGLGPLLLTRVAPRLTGRVALLVALGLFGAGDLLFGLQPGYEVALFLRLVVGAASGVLSYAQLTVAAEAGDKAVTAMTAGFILALVLGVPAGAFATDDLGAGAFYLSLAGTAGVLVVATVRAVPRRQTTPTEQATRSFRTLWRSPALRRGILASVLVAAAVGGPVAIFPSALASPEAAGLDLKERGLVYLFAGLGPLLALWLGMLFLRRFDRHEVAAGGAVLMALPLLLMPAASQTAVAAALLLVGAIFIETLRRSALQGHIALLAPAADRPRYLALRNVLVQVGVAGGVLLAQQLRDLRGLGTACLAAALLSLVSAAAIPGRGESE